MNEQSETAAPISTAEQAYAEIQRLIVIGTLPAYELLSENDLARRIGCGRTPVREALQRLKFEGFVDILPRRGIMVTPVDITRQLELLETRRPLEELMVSLAAVRADERQRAEMLRLADELERAIAARDRGRYLEINREIHRIEAEAARNRYLTQHIHLLHGLSRRFWYSFITETESFSEAAVHHARTLRAIAAGEPETARQECVALLDLLEQVSQKAIRERLRGG
ncbi:GntR family transcriptional regulator [Paralimibaculum aggregatum]|uniref:GntR family transcriptional regulator n=1 Tax=Paralimibaculum aggregatum TaxID=3036245 RepID=A0ABQ6LSK4_9RHOB|nr:GntR family transcriptional regulator [Limibaculum sp. NKW23]GMG85054.1 GntR family transcriptional regulator [Limibaculum sp. NKW23]